MKKKQKKELSNIGYPRLVFQAIPEIWSFQIIISLVLAFVVGIMSPLIRYIANSGRGPITTANIGSFILSFRFPLLLLLGIIFVLLFVILELFAQIYMCNAIITGEKAGILRSISQGVEGIRRFFNPMGVLVLLYIFIAVPLCGIGFSISLTKNFYIPHFIMEVVNKTPLYAVAYYGFIILLAVTGFTSVFTVHGVLTDGMTPSEARLHSVNIIKKNWKDFVVRMLRLLLICGIIQVVAWIFFNHELTKVVDYFGTDVNNVRINLFEEDYGGLSTDELVDMILHRIGATFAVMMGDYLNSVVVMLIAGYIMLRFTRFYYEYSHGSCTLWKQRPKKSRYFTKLIAMIVVFIIIGIGSLYIGLNYDQVVGRDEPVKIVAHRAGGTLASENSNEGLYKAIEHGCYASEIDTQRTKDGYYIINHDSDFGRLTGVAKAPEEMTLDEIKKLSITDTTGNGNKLSVPTLEEQLDIIKGKEKLFIELKGATADKRMVDDVVALVKSKDCVEDVALISLKYDIIDYAETNYPEFETGVLFFAGIGDVSGLNCDLLIMEEEMATFLRIQEVHAAGKQAIVWTVNTEESMDKFLDTKIDGIITDEIELAEKVEAAHKDRNEYDTIKAWYEHNR